MHTANTQAENKHWEELHFDCQTCCGIASNEISSQEEDEIGTSYIYRSTSSSNQEGYVTNSYAQVAGFPHDMCGVGDKIWFGEVVLACFEPAYISYEVAAGNNAPH